MKGMGGRGAMKMGIMDADYIDTADTSNAIGDQYYQYGFYIAAISKPRRYINGSLSLSSAFDCKRSFPEVKAHQECIQ